MHVHTLLQGAETYDPGTREQTVKTHANPQDSQAACHAAIELLENGEYERVEGLLREARASFEQTTDPRTLHFLDTVHRMSVACSKCREEAEWHGNARDQAQEREQRLERELHTMLELISNGDLGDVLAMTQEPSAGAQPNDGWSDHRPKSTGFGLWRRIQTLLRSDRKPPANGNGITHRDSAARDEPAGNGSALPKALPDIGIRERPTLAADGRPSLAVYCLGPFEVHQNDDPIGDWLSSKGKSVFKYLVTHRQRPVAKEVLMELFWPDAKPRCARNSLNVAIYRMRQALSTQPAFSHVLYQNDCYLLNPDLDVWIDFEAFDKHIANARLWERREEVAQAMREYAAAEALYRGEFLEEDRYESWIVPQRQSLQEDYLKALERLGRYYFEQGDYDACVAMCSKILSVDACQEGAHRQMMRCYSRQKRSNLAVRQFQRCVRVLEKELGVVPSMPTIDMYQRIRRHQPV